jgi:hypothetical protein
MKHLLLPLFLILFTATFCQAQNNSTAYQQLVADSAKRNGLTEASLRTPQLRQIYISTDIITKGNVTSKLNGEPLFKGRAQTIRTSAIFNIPIKSWGKNSVSATASYFAQDLKIGEIQWADGRAGNRDLDFNKFAVGLTANFQRRDSLFGKPVFYMASVSGLTNDASMVKKVSYLASAIFTFKQTATTRIAAGVLVNIDPSLSVPAFPVFSYWHQFNHQLELNITLPSGAGLRKTVTKNLWATLGTSLSGSVAFLNINYPNLPHDVNYTTLDLKTGLGLEYRLGKRFMFGANGGILSPLQARAFERNQSSKNYFLDNKLSNTPYINFSFSVLPFL